MCWNIRGINFLNKIRDIFFFCKENNLYLCGFVEI